MEKVCVGGARGRGEAGDWALCVSALLRPLEGRLELGVELSSVAKII